MASRNTVNQRLSRARKQSYIKDLEIKVRQYESNGIKVTAEIQAAARKVADENRRLKLLLRLKLGVDEREIDSMLREIEADMNPKKSGLKQGYGPTTSEESGSRQSKDVSGDSIEMQQICQTAATGPPSLKRKFDDLQSSSTSTRVGCLSTQSSLPPEITASPIAVSSSTKTMNIPIATPKYCLTSGCSSADSVADNKSVSGLLFSEQQQQTAVSSPGNRKSCEEAALIITSMRGVHKGQEVWSRLGCGNSTECDIDNMKLFKILDEVG